jgi:hypothetical protein
MLDNGESSLADDRFATDMAGSAEIIPLGHRATGSATTTSSSGGLNWQEVLLREIISLQKLNRGWDSYDAPPISLDAMEFASIVLYNIMQPHTPLPQVVPTSVGGVQLEWHERGIDLEIHVTGSYEGEIWYEDHRRSRAEPFSDEMTNDFSQLQSFVTELTRRGVLVQHAV